MSLIRNLVVDTDESFNPSLSPSEIIDAFAYDVFNKVHDKTTGILVRMKCVYPLRIIMHKKADIKTRLISTKTLVNWSYGKIVRRSVKIR